MLYKIICNINQHNLLNEPTVVASFGTANTELIYSKLGVGPALVVQGIGEGQQALVVGGARHHGLVDDGWLSNPPINIT